MTTQKPGVPRLVFPEATVSPGPTIFGRVEPRLSRVLDEAWVAGCDPKMLDPDLRPALRPLQIDRVTQDGRSGVAVTDPLGLSESTVFIPEGLLPVVGRFDGTLTVAEIVAEIRAETGQILPDELVPGLVEQFERLLFLDNSHFRDVLRDGATSFLQAGVRPSVHAGVAAGFPSDPQALRRAFESIVHRPDDPLRPPPRGLVAPHIDVARGREGYSLAYSALAERQPADLYVVFGTGHQGPQAPVTGLALDWATPLGTVATDRDFVAAVHRRLGEPHPADVLLHRREHSLEFQMAFLRHVLGDHPFQVAGFLTGHLPHDGPVDDEPVVQDLVAALRDAAVAAEAAGRRVCFVAGADLAHIGPHFGDPTPVDEARREELAAVEARRLRFLEHGEPGRFHAAVEADGNPDRICGGTPIYLTATLAGGTAQPLHYGQANAVDGSQTVSYCAMILGDGG